MTVYREKTCACGHAAIFHEPGKKRGRCTYGADRSRFGTTVAPCACLKFHRRASPAAAYADDALDAPPASLPALSAKLAAMEPMESEVLASIDDIIRAFTRLRAALPMRGRPFAPTPLKNSIPYVPVNFPLRRALDEQKAERRKERAKKTPGDTKLSRAERKIMTVLAQHLDGLSKAQVALMSGYSASSGGFRNSLSTLRTAGRIDGDQKRFIITGAGVADLGDFESLPRGGALLEYWMKHAGDKCARAILSELATVRLKMPKAVLAERTGYQATSGGFRNALSRLRTLGLIAGSAELALTPEFAKAIA